MDSFEPKFKSSSVYLLPRTKRTEEYEARKKEAEDKQKREMMRVRFQRILLKFSVLRTRSETKKGSRSSEWSKTTRLV